ncbi:MAG: long-chain fatty acid--CoA ligase [Bacteroidales bacterium]|nr:long-chain fatty acid--CoA ligase [Bacteroidales bacterium]
MEITRLFDILERDLKEFPIEDALCGKENGVMIKYSTEQYVQIVNNISYGLMQLGIKKGDCVATITPNRPEWNFLDMAIMQIGAIHVAIYPTISESDYDYILHHANIKLIFVSGWELLRKITAIIANIPELNDKVYTFRNLLGYRHLSELIELGRANPSPQYLQEIKDSIKPDDVVSFVYTSGTTGNPKGVMLTHENFLTNIRGVLPIIPTSENNRILSYLPLCHVYERMLNYAFQSLGLPIYYCENIAKIQQDMAELRPDIFTTVPRLLEKVYDKILAQGNKMTGIKRKIFFWANEVALNYEFNPSKSYKRKLKLARKLVLNKWHEALGGNFKVIVSGGAAIQPRIARVFWAMGIPILEGYGTTESAPVIAVSDFFKGGLEFGAAGHVLPGTRVRIADDGEILTKGKHVMKGYYNAPDLTAEAIDEDGWLHTGDLGKLTPGGRVKITGRKKEMFKTAFGKYVVPTLIESKFSEDPLIDNILVVGENQKFAAALIVPNFSDLRDWCHKHEIDYTTNEEMINHPKVQALFKKIVDKYNRFFGDTEKVKSFSLVGYEWSIQTGELTPTLKLKRNKLIEKYSEQIEQLFNK